MHLDSSENHYQDQLFLSWFFSWLIVDLSNYLRFTIDLSRFDAMYHKKNLSFILSIT